MKYISSLLLLFTLIAIVSGKVLENTKLPLVGNQQHNTRLELIELLPQCYNDSILIIDEDGIEKAVANPEEVCYYESIIQEPDSLVKIDFDYIGKRVQLNDFGYDSVMTIFNSSNTSNSNTIIEIADCYSPRNGIIRYDSSNEVVGFLEICFECNKYTVAGEMPDLRDIDLEKMKQFFESYQLKTE